MVEEHAHHLGHPPHLDQRKAKTLFEGRMKLWLDAGADADSHAVVPVVGTWRPPKQQWCDHAEIMNDAGACLPDLAPPAIGVKSIGLDLATAVLNDGVERKHRRVDV